MPNYRRSATLGGLYFFTLVTYQRRKIFHDAQTRHWLRDAIDATRKKYPFDVDAWVLLPEHLHCIWRLPEKDKDFSTRWSLIKSRFSKRSRDYLHDPARLTASREVHRESTIWQRRFWEHEIRDEADYRTHMDYIHINPVKHGLVERVKDWPWSTFHRYVREGMYPESWGGRIVQRNGRNFGE